MHTRTQTPVPPISSSSWKRRLGITRSGTARASQLVSERLAAGPFRFAIGVQSRVHAFSLSVYRVARLLVAAQLGNRLGCFPSFETTVCACRRRSLLQRAPRGPCS